MKSTAELVAEMKQLNIVESTVGELVAEMRKLNVNVVESDVKEVVPNSIDELKALKLRHPFAYEKVLKKYKLWNEKCWKVSREYTKLEVNRIECFKRRKAGLCVQCGSDSEGFYLCAKHRARLRELRKFRQLSQINKKL